MSVHGIVEQYPRESYPSQPRHNAESSAEDTEFRALFTKRYFKKQSQKSTGVGAVYLTTSIPPTIHPYPTDYYHQPRVCILISQSLREERVPPPLEYLNTVIVLSNAILILVKSIQSRTEISSRMSRRSRVPIFVSFIKTEDIELECVVSGWADSGFQMLARTTESSIVIRQITASRDAQASTAWVGSWFLGGPNSEYLFDILLTNARYSLLTYGWQDLCFTCK
ncbi:hypothetical protein ALC56_02644 [Trachymyrmex septentrionalis]|uniref:Uncharacterized protein n=1 Tax=Trachymyrmex septentrionalis TaxID=34720 RepID=A0A195FRD1_9HYME|nr:hypothetical protein ALC56_02644 [Trachymyrmex septentrionalis]